MRKEGILGFGGILVGGLESRAALDIAAKRGNLEGSQEGGFLENLDTLPEILNVLALTCILFGAIAITSSSYKAYIERNNAA